VHAEFYKRDVNCLIIRDAEQTRVCLQFTTHCCKM